MNNASASERVPWAVLLSELVGTAFLLGIGLSIVIAAFGSGSPVIKWIPDPGIRRALTGFLFGTTGALIAISPVGKHSGAHINPAVTLAFRLIGKMSYRLASGYILAQLVGAIIGALPLIVWGTMGATVDFGATTPAPDYGPIAALAGETATTFCLVLGLFLFIGHHPLRRFTPALFPFLYAAMVFLEAPVSGTSTNPARSLGPAVISGVWHGWWIYWLGPGLGTILAVLAHRRAWRHRLRIEVAKIYHFHHDPHGVFHPGSTRTQKSFPSQRSTSGQ